MKTQRLPSRSTLMIAIAAGLLVPQAAAQPAQAIPSAVSLTLGLAPDGTATLVVDQAWTGPAARSFRQSLDVYFGASDGTLTDDEVQRIAEATQADMVGEPLPWLSTGGTPWAVTSVVVAFEGAAGDADSPQDMRVRHEVALATGAAQLVESVDIDAPWDATLAVTVPDGKAVLDGAPGQVTSTARTSLRIGDAPPPAPAPEPVPQAAPVPEAAPEPAPEPEKAEDASPARPPATRILLTLGGILLAILILGGLGAGAYLWKGRRKRAST